MNANGKTLGIIILFAMLISPGCKKSTGSSPDTRPTVRDNDGNVYHLVTVGSQVWMVENLRVKHYRNGDPVQDGSGIKHPQVADTTGTFWAYENNSGYIADYGLLYNWYAASDKRNIAPQGFHVPSDDDWGALVSSLGGDYYYVLGDSIAGGKLKEAGNDHWGSAGDPRTNVGATNSSNWTGRPGGILYQGIFEDIRDFGAWWASTSLTGVQKDEGYEMVLSFMTKGASRGANLKASGLSVRCVKDH